MASLHSPQACTGTRHLKVFESFCLRFSFHGIIKTFSISSKMCDRIDRHRISNATLKT